MKKLLLSIYLFIALSFSAYGIDVGDISSFINSDRSSISKEIKNSTDTGRLVNVGVKRISSPLEDGVEIPFEAHDELLFTPTKLLLPAQSGDIVRFVYNGPHDDKERYYRIIWFDQSLDESQNTSAKRSAVASASARIGTILVVAPREVRYSYHYENGFITNTGNATLRVLAYGACIKGKEDCKEKYFLMPGRKRKFNIVNVNDKKGRVALWQGEQFIPVK